jgi:hypothetical protein
VEGVADLSSRERLERVGLALPVPDRRQWASFWAVGEALFAEGLAGILYPAAARPDALALCLFRTGDRFPGVRPLATPVRVRHDEPPAPPRGLRA